MHAEICQRVANFIELERLDNRGAVCVEISDFSAPVF
jgi:hypothetical protein